MKITVATFNMLYEAHYQRYATVETMPALQRLQLQKTVLADLAARCDVLFFQECHFGGDDFKTIAPSHTFVRANARDRETCAIAFNHATFRMDGTPVVNAFRDARSGRSLPKCTLSVFLVPTEGQPIPVCMTCCHAPWAPSAAGRAAVVDQIASCVDPSTCFPGACVVAGDFNVDSSDTAAFTALTRAGFEDQSTTDGPTVISARGTFDKIDFVFARGFARSAEPAQRVPADPFSLIRHVPLAASAVACHTASSKQPELPFADFPSDHAAVLTTLVLP